jgi:hypothetical protein
MALVPDLCPTSVKILAHLISRYYLPLKAYISRHNMQPNTLFKMEIQRMFLPFLYNLNCVVFSHLVWIYDIEGERK